MQAEGALKDLSPEKRRKEHQASIKPLVEEFFAWVKEQVTGVSRTALSLRNSRNRRVTVQTNSGKSYVENQNIDIIIEMCRNRIK